MPTLSWLTDPHLNFLTPDALDTFVDRLALDCEDGLVISGDIAESPSVTTLLEVLDAALDVPIFFVLGNHDYYFGGIAETRERVRTWARRSRRSHWLPDVGICSLSDTTALIGHGAWSDGRVGDFMASSIVLNDYRHIEDLVFERKTDLYRRIRELGDEAADYLGEQLSRALKSHRHVIVVTHSPPFAEACWYQGRAVVGEWTPHFTCAAVGKRLLEVVESYPDRTVEVVCGHTHNAGEVRMAPNLLVRTGAAIYEAPALLDPISVP